MKKTIVTIGLDNGNKYTKTDIGKFLEESSAIKVTDKFLANGKKVIKFEDSLYVIGEGRKSVKLKKFEDDDTFIISLCAIAYELERMGIEEEVDIILGVGLPLMSYGKYKEKMKSYFLRRDIQVTYNDKEFKFSIVDVNVFPQGMAAFTSVINKYKDYDVCNVLDLGGYTFDTFQTGENGIPALYTLKSYTIGIITLLENIKQLLLKEEINLTDRQIEKIIKNEDLFIIDSRVTEIIKEMTNEYIKELINKAKESGMELKNPTIFIGGGFNLIEEYIRESEEFNYIEFMDIFANAKGYKNLVLQQEKGIK